MRLQRRLIAATLLVLLAPSAFAAYGEGSLLEASVPIQLDGRVDTLLPNGIATFVAPKGAILGVSMRAPEASITFTRTVERCSGAEAPTGCVGSSMRAPEDDAPIALNDVRVAVLRTMTDYKFLVTTDRTYADSASFGDAGRLILSTAGATRLDATPTGTHLSPTDADWTGDDEQTQVLEPVYGLPALSARYLSTGAVIRATGGFETYFQGVVVHVEGVDKSGKAFSRDYETPFPQSPDDDLSFLRIEAKQGDLAATGAGALTGLASPDDRPTSDVHTRARFEDATGRVFRDGDQQDYNNAPVELAGPLNLAVEKTMDGERPRMRVAIADGLQLGDLPPVDDESEPTDPLLVAGAAAGGASGAGLLIALAYFWPRLKFASTLLFLPLYSRIERESVLEHEKRDELYELIRATPGIHAHEIGEKANIGWGTTVYHLKLLEGHGLVVSKKSGRYKRFFVNTGEYTKKKDVYGALRNDTARSVADFIVNHPGTTQKDMCAALGIQPSLASWHVEKLEGVGLVKRVKDGRQVRYFAGPAWSDLNVQVNPTGGADTPAET